MSKSYSGCIAENVKVADGTCRMTLELDRPLSYMPGQYIMLSLANDPATKRSYSLMASGGKSIVLGIRNQGGFSATLCDAKPGTEANVLGPYGRFALPEGKHVVLIGGGIGITPLYSMAKSISAQHGDVALYYTAQSKSSAAFLDEILALDKVTVRIYLTREHGTSTETTRYGKRLTVEDMQNDLPDFASRTFILCGTPHMVEHLTKELVAHGVSEDSILSEEFGKNG